MSIDTSTDNLLIQGSINDAQGFLTTPIEPVLSRYEMLKALKKRSINI